MKRTALCYGAQMSCSRYFLLLSLLLSLLISDLSQAKTIVSSVTKSQMLLLRQVDQKYQKQHGIHIEFKKSILLGILGTKKSSEGELWLSDGQMRLDIKKPESSRVVAGLEFLWIESPVLDGERPQVLKTTLNSKKAQSQALIQLLTRGGVFKHFRVTGVKIDGKRLNYFLQPDQSSVEFKRAQIQVDPQSRELLTLKYWDQMDNETTYTFIKTEFDQKLDKKIFAYKPPENAELVVF